jgi:sporulation protein YlmC with PRC-barrel domain
MFEVGDIVQVDPMKAVFGACMVVVTEVKAWGIQGYVNIPMQGDAYIRLEWDKIDYIGDAVLVHQKSEEQ